MAVKYLVKAGDKYLYPSKDGDVGYTASIIEAGVFDTWEEAQKCAVQNAKPPFEIIAVDPARF
ncbi:hypothetical protein LG200_11590 [Methylobacillus caricis]|uniref:hypothetical protein n=1 Tax=Methylobacillus caricis TaxID=1971611 RepID=UPI001CFFF2F6|nr:hypothetical protein [Methylobacillus caricis]MCB5188641.1 hypothetical protein [Methylobacillus caricis]